VIRVRQFGPALVRHVEAYGLLAAAAARDLRAIAMRRMLLAAVGAGLGIAAVVLLGATVIAVGWATPYRGWIAAGVVAALAVAAVGCFMAARAELPRSSDLQALQGEWQKDRAWLATPDRAARPLGESPPGREPGRGGPESTAVSAHQT
jgi:uncharacterized membrane protein YqjE